MDKLQQIIGDYAVFVQSLLEQVETAGFDMSDFVQMDHLCYRTVSEDNYRLKKEALSAVAMLLHETMVNGRQIATFRLRKPIRVGTWRIDAIELPAPKQGSNHTEGLEHAEFVIYDDLASFRQKYADKTFNLASADRGINPEISYQLANCAVKFHLLNLTTVVYLEKKLDISEVRNN